MNGTVNKIKEYWFLIIFIGGIVVWSVRLEDKVHAMQERSLKLRTDYETGILQMKADIKEIKINQERIMVRMGIEP